MLACNSDDPDRPEREGSPAGTAALSMESGTWRDHFGSVPGGRSVGRKRDQERTKKDRRPDERKGGEESGARDGPKWPAPGQG